MSNNQYQTLDRSDIEDIFNELIDENGQATSLEVKNELRNRGFWATQAIVGVAIREIADEQGNDWDFNGVYRTYREVGQSTLMSPTSVQAGVPSGLVSVGGSSASKPKRNPASPQDREPVDNPTSGDWECSDLGSNPVFFKSSLTGPQARYAYALETDTTYVNVRSIRVA